MEIWLAIAGMALVTFLTRVVGVFALGGEAPVWVQRWLAHVPVAVFTALVVPTVLLQSGTPGPQIVIGPSAGASLIGAFVAWRTNNVMVTIIAGFAGFWLLRWLGM
jgi:branched-subunit amino acid transport protein